VDRERAALQLRLIGETVEVANALGVEVWLRGGWAVDFYLGGLTRDHEDIDWFVWARDASRLAEGLGRQGYEPVPGAPPAQQLDFAKWGVESAFALLDEDPSGRVVVAGGPWAGEAWPDGMLDAPPARMGLVRCRIVSPQAQIEVKRMTPVWMPGRERREKDAADIARLEAAIAARGAGRCATG
jgi:hypothetical protein